jgi:hypothetical protein
MNSPEGWVLRRYNMLPTDPRFLAMTPLDLELEVASDTLWAAAQKRQADGQPVRNLSDLTVEEDFEARLARLLEEDRKRDEAARLAAASDDSEKVITFTAKGA